MDKKGKNYKQADAEKVKTSASKTTKSESKRSGTRSGYAVFAVLLVAVAIILGFYWNQTTSITNIDIKGNYYTDKGQILKHANIPNGVNPDSIDALSVIINIELLP
jgi:cell division septal protein FtsQ